VSLYSDIFETLNQMQVAVSFLAPQSHQSKQASKLNGTSGNVKLENYAVQRSEMD
jgi:hypothetical protein